MIPSCDNPTVSKVRGCIASFPLTTTLDGASYTYDLARNRKTRTDKRLGTTLTYTYDNVYQLLTAKQGTTTKESYTYDLAGNRLSSLGVSPYQYNVSNELTTVPSGSYTYDNNGSELTDPSGKQYTWDFENRLTQVVLPSGGGTVTFKYDPFGRRVQKAFTQGSTTTTTNYLYDGSNQLEEVDQSGNVLARYTQGKNIDEAFSQLRSGAASYYHADGLGSITSLSNPAGTLAQTYVYDSFGQLTSSAGTLVNSLQYAAREFDSETSLYFNRARYYHPTIGRFGSEDPIQFAGGVNFYGYVRNNPIILIDPTGKQGRGGWGTLPPNPTLNTHVCDGNGGQVPQIGNPGTPEQARCLRDCIIVHELNHIINSMMAVPTICVGQPAGTLVGSWGLTHNLSEIMASNAEINCLRSKLKPWALQRNHQSSHYPDGEIS
ncbi:MAG TPA: RHS repeat-associated core domain-containing protein [Candidatus Bathyarchaeia archaeon]|nr:RHS repeat-associated core domain-containing protein [Candidatus Bathyarchaeia archaeon]